MTSHLSHQTVQEFHQHGATVLKGVFADWIGTLRDGVDYNMAHPAPNARDYKTDEGGRFLSDYCNWDRIDAYRDFIFNSPAAEIGAELMGSTSVRLFHEHVIVKTAKTGMPTPWHQDLPYYCIDATQTVSIWIPLDVVPRDRTLEFVAGSHKWGKFYRPQRFDGTALNENDGLEELPDIDGHRDDYDILGWALEPGDAVAFDYRTVHGAPANNSPSAQRRAFSLRLVGDDATFARRDGIISSPPFENVALKHGDPLEAAEFPVLLQSGF
ncbi:phytanoyl-CoA dioxygenase family protein [Roseovarius sp. 2305UL8-3]|uniref:phytanoyl-CoA dioxygenase family protein n=1 Tax=Roseovarius conchicola TaxID=3121636 RepID=UPI003527A9B8